MPWSETGTEDLAFRLQPAATVTGTMVTASGAPLPGTRVRLSPEWPPGEFGGVVASRMGIVDEEVTTDERGAFACASLRPGAYRVSFPDRPDWPAVRVSADELQKGTVAVRVPWENR
jgi:hypothetical protein